VFICQVIDWKSKFTANCNEASGDVLYGDWARIPCVMKEENRLKGNLDRVALIGHDLEAFCKVSIDSFDYHWVMVVA
jgi:hypothetical protein